MSADLLLARRIPVVTTRAWDEDFTNPISATPDWDGNGFMLTLGHPMAQWIRDRMIEQKNIYITKDDASFDSHAGQRTSWIVTKIESYQDCYGGYMSVQCEQS